MKLSISNIAWAKEYDEEMYGFIKDQGFAGLEIAPSRLFPESPYTHIDEAMKFAKLLKSHYGLNISSIQSMWFGKNENIFVSEQERRILVDYTKHVIDFAASVKCRNIVFGNPKNRTMHDDELRTENFAKAVDFFNELGEYAESLATVISIEPNPPIYNTNFINTTTEAMEFCRMINRKGIRVNVDIGTMIYYDESIELIINNLELINHIHISEPYLAAIQERFVHQQLKNLNYDGYISIEMKNLNNIEIVKQIVRYIKGVFN